MSWTSFTLLYLGVACLALGLCRRVFAGQWRRLMKVLCFGTLLLLLGDSIAEHRQLWTIPDPSGYTVLGAPLENALVVVATLLNSLLLYLVLEARSRRKETGR